MRVSFMIIGAQKCGTTSLAAQLAAHPEICFCRIKEPGYFHKTRNWRAGLRAYHRLYSPAAGQICGEASTMYTFLPEWEGTHTRLHEYNPDLKLIYVMRQPVERIISSYAHDLVRGLVKEPPEIAVSQNPAYVNRSRYGMQLAPYLELFPREQVLLLLFEEYTSAQAATLEAVAQFLGVAPEPFLAMEPAALHQTVGNWYWKSDTVSDAVNSRWGKVVRRYVPARVREAAKRLLSNRLESKPQFSRELRQALWRLLEGDVVVVEQLLGRDLAMWRAKEGA